MKKSKLKPIDITYEEERYVTYQNYTARFIVVKNYPQIDLENSLKSIIETELKYGKDPYKVISQPIDLRSS